MKRETEGGGGRKEPHNWKIALQFFAYMHHCNDVFVAFAAQFIPCIQVWPEVMSLFVRDVSVFMVHKKSCSNIFMLTFEDPFRKRSR